MGAGDQEMNKRQASSSVPRLLAKIVGIKDLIVQIKEKYTVNQPIRG